MTPLEATGPNAEQIKFWNETGGANFIKQQRMIDATVRPMGLLALDRAGIKEGERVLDVGCGCGDSSLEIARRLGPGGKVIGLDISTPMLDRAIASAHAEGISNIEFINCDAQTYRLSAAAFDLIFSRFGVMFFAEPSAAFANLLSALKKNGRLAFVCWQSPMKNAWMSVPGMVAAQYVQVSPPAPEAPGPFAFADGSRVRSILEGAGFANIAVEDRSVSMRLPGVDIEQTVAFMMEMGPAGAALREADSQVRSKVANALRDTFKQYLTDDGVRMDGAYWVVTANRPGI